jgi:hypothetical protein
MVQQTETAIREGRHFKTTESKRHTLGDAIERYINDVIPTKPKNTVNQVGQLKWWKENLGDYSIERYTVRELIQEMNTLTKIKYSGKYGNILTEVTKPLCEILKCLNIELPGKT